MRQRHNTKREESPHHPPFSKPVKADLASLWHLSTDDHHRLLQTMDALSDVVRIVRCMQSCRNMEEVQEKGEARVPCLTAFILVTPPPFTGPEAVCTNRVLCRMCPSPCTQGPRTQGMYTYAGNTAPSLPSPRVRVKSLHPPLPHPPTLACVNFSN